MPVRPEIALNRGCVQKAFPLAAAPLSRNFVLILDWTKGGCRRSYNDYSSKVVATVHTEQLIHYA